MLRVYIPQPLPDIHLAHLFTVLSESLNYTQNLPPNFFETEVERVTDAAKADVIVLSNNFKDPLTAHAQAYVKNYADLGAQLHIPVCAFSLGDLTSQAILDPRVHVLRFSLYKSEAAPLDVSMPSLIEDRASGGITLRTKADTPCVSFCGQTGYKTKKQWLKYYAKVFIGSLRALVKPLARAHIVGVYWRRAAMAACSRSPLVDTLFITRSTYSGIKKTIELDPAQARREYLDSIVNSDFVLAPKGDGNYSNRFLEALSLGRIPVLIDTDTVLPFEDSIDYSRIVVRVPMNRVGETPRYIREFYDALTNEEWQERQRLARTIFETLLRQDAFLQLFFKSRLHRP